MVHNNEEKQEYEPETEGVHTDIHDEVIAEEDQLLAIQKLKEKLTLCVKERKEYLDGWQRTKADYLNSKKRFEEERLGAMTRGEAKTIEHFLPLIDSLDMALRNITNEQQDTQLHKGLLQIVQQLQQTLRTLSVEPIDPLREIFDPQKHEALSTRKTTEEKEHDVVVEVLQKGYMHNGIVLRPAKVIIGMYENN